MSHVIKVRKVNFMDLSALQSAVDSLPNVHFMTPDKKKVSSVEEATGKHRLYSGPCSDGVAIQLPGWNYPVIVTSSGDMLFDNYSGYWGKQDEIDGLVQAYSVEKIKLDAAVQNLMAAATEETLDDGSIRLTYEYVG